MQNEVKKYGAPDRDMIKRSPVTSIKSHLKHIKS